MEIREDAMSKMYVFRLSLAAEGQDVDSAFLELLQALKDSPGDALSTRLVEQVDYREVDPDDLVCGPVEPEDLSYSDDEISDMVSMVDWSGGTNVTTA